MATRSLTIARRVVTDDIRRLHRHLLVAAAALLGIEAIALVFNVDVITRVNSAWPQIYPYTILGMVALVGAMTLFGRPQPWAVWTGRALASLTLLLGAGVDILVGLGVLPSNDPLSDTSASLATALPSLAAVATSAAVLLITARGTVVAWIRFGLLAFATAITVLIILGYLYGSDQLIQGLGRTGTSLPAALLGLVILGAAASARPDQPPLSGLDERYDTRLLRGILPLLVAAPFVPAIVVGIVGAVIDDPASAAAVAELATVVILVTLIAVMGAAQSRARRELLLQRQRVWDAFAQAPAATAIVTLDGRIVTANQALERLTHRGQPDLVGALVPDLISETDHVRVSEAIAEVAAGRDHVRREIRFRGTGSASTWADLSIAAVRDSGDRVLYLILQATDLTDRQHVERILSEQSLRDPLTGLLSRAGLDQRLDSLWHSRTPSDEVVVLCIDIDDLRSVNDTLGPTAGDELLREVARRLRGCTRGDDILARSGSDEFVVVTTVVARDPGATESLLARIRQELSGPVAAGRDLIPLAVTVGATSLADLSGSLPPADGYRRRDPRANA